MANEKSRAELKKLLLLLNESKLKQFFQKAAPKCQTINDSMLLTDTLKEVCEEKGFEADNIMTYD
ncbi:MAG: hypothetical protein OXM61_17345 [Candidatus Poribacteria bacterium]|nr:hypothetical protein [Candidatus Poribacteria bacterium]